MGIWQYLFGPAVFYYTQQLLSLFAHSDFCSGEDCGADQQATIVYNFQSNVASGKHRWATLGCEVFLWIPS